jgi:glutaminase
VRALVDEAYARFEAVAEGKNSRAYPALARVPSELFGICLVGTSDAQLDEHPALPRELQSQAISTTSIS